MKKIIKYLFFIFLFFPIIRINALSNDDVNYSVKRYYVNSNMEIAGGLRVKELIQVNGTYNGYSRNIHTFNKSLIEFTGLDSDLEGSSIYNPTSIAKVKVGIFKSTDKVEFNLLSEENIENKVDYFEEVDIASKGDKGVYTIEEKDGIYDIKIYNETINDSTIFYLDYVVTNVLVEHNDCAEFYYNFISTDWNDPIEDVIVYVSLPYPSTDLFKVWAHGQINGDVRMAEDKSGIIARINNYKLGTGFDIRTVFDLDLFTININQSKKSEMDALPIIEQIEKKRADDSNKIRTSSKILYYTFFGIECFYIILLIGLILLIFIKYDREPKSKFKGKYYREFIDDYDVEVIDYLMKKRISDSAFSTSILNLIYKKNIKVQEIKKKSKIDYSFILDSEKGLSKSERIIIDLLFKKIGSNNKVLLSDIKQEAKNISSDGENTIFDSFNSWKISVEQEAINNNFYENNKKIKLILGSFGLIGVLLFILDNTLIQTYLRFITLPLSIIYLIYVVIFNKRTIKGNEHYYKWCAFKKFLNDFGRLSEKDLPELILWEKYLVYASIFGIADKLKKTMKIKFESMNVDSNNIGHGMIDYYVLSNLTSNINDTINNSVSNARNSAIAAKSRMASGSGSGGGFSSGGGFGGAGNSGSGF